MSLKNLSAKNKIHKFFKNKLKNKRISKIYNKFEKSLNISENFAVAVSGGPDSLALVFLAKIYAIKKKLNPKFLIVNHKLRPESSIEAENVQKLLKKFIIKAEILTWKEKKPVKNIQAIARIKRYQLLSKKCEHYKISNLLLGHHQDDLFENFFIRLLRGSGLKGLISLDKESKANNMNLLRPLLDQKKEDLIYVTKNIFDFYVHDPSNKDAKYQRIKIRSLIENLNKEGLDKKKFAETLKNLKYSNNVVKFYVNKNLEINTFFSKSGKRLILNKEFFQQPYEIIFRGLSDSIKAVGKKYYSARGKKLDKIISDVENNQSFKATLGGCIIEKANQTVIISKEC